jgi:outer membrane protein OmpA-like peptidoglycan-associated protein
VRRAVAGLVAALVLLTACTTGTDPDPASSGTTSPSGTASASVEPTSGPQAVVVQATYLSVPIEVEVAPVEVKDGVALLTVEYRIAAGAPAGASFSVGQVLKTTKGPVGPNAVRLVDLGSATVYPPGTDAKDQPAVTRDYLAATAGKPSTSQGFYGAPMGETVAVLFPYLGLVADVPVVRLSASDELATTPQELGRTGKIDYLSAPIDAFSVAFDDSSSTRVTQEEVTVSLASDVLFAVDQSDLTPAAQAVVDSAAAAIKAEGAEGEVHVTGHTDDVASDAYNQDLSVRRAQSVVDRLVPALGAGFAVSAEGRGESEPAVAGTTPEARAANRRVEIRFTARTAGTTVEIAGSGAVVPDATGPTASGLAAVEVTAVPGYTVRAAAVQRVGAYLLGSLEVTRTASGTGQPTGIFGDFAQGRAISRGLSAYSMGAGAHNATLLGVAARYYPSDYVRGASSTEQDLRAIVGDEWFVAPMKQGESVTATVLWPDPGGPTVTIDVPERFRLAAVPVTTP